MRHRRLDGVLWGFALLLVASCGGGGGDGASPVAIPPAVEPPPVAQSITKAGGDGQTAAPGSAVAVPPAVQVTNNLGAPMADAPVTFLVTSGGGQVQTTNSRTDPTGRASSGNWTLGPSAGPNTLSASVAGLAAVSFTAKAAAKAAEVTLSVQSPGEGQTVGEAMRVTATVASTYQLAGVSASAGGRTVALDFGAYGSYGGNAWSAILSLAGQPRGSVGLVVTATDVFAHATDAVLGVTLDRAPVVGVVNPAEGTVARPSIDIAANCSDDDAAGCVSLVASVNGTVLGSAKNALAQTLDLSAYEGQNISLVVVGTDTIGQRSTVTRNLYVESSALLSVHAVVGGPVWDLSGTRILHVDLSSAVPALEILDRQTGSTQTLETGPDLVGTWGDYGFLTPSGALYVHGSVSNSVYPYAWLYEWRAGALTQITGLDSAQSLRVAGNWAIYNLGAELWRRDLGAGVSTLLTATAGNWANDVAANGDVVFWGQDYNIYRWRNGSTQALSAYPSGGLWNTYPLTDGMNAVFRRHSPCCGTQTYRIVVDDGTQQSYLTPATFAEPNPGGGYAVAGGYVAYAAEDLTKTLQIWRHGTGGEQQLTFFGSSSRIDAILPDGTVLLTQQQKRYRARPGQALQAIGSALGRVIVRDGLAWVLIDRTVLAVGP
jgi:hypothetical protein